MLNGKWQEIDKIEIYSELIICRILCFIKIRCHGEVDNVVHELAKDENLFDSNELVYEIFNFIQSDGTQVPQYLSDELCAVGFEIIDTLKNNGVKNDYKGSLGNFVAEK